MENLSMAIIIIITSIILPMFLSADDDIYIDKNSVERQQSKSFNFSENVGPNYPKSITLECYNNNICRIGFTYDDKFIYAEGDYQGDCSEQMLTFQANEFINTIILCKNPIVNTVTFKKFVTNKNNSLSCGGGGSGCKELNYTGYAIAGFYGTTKQYIASLGIIYHKFYYSCSELEIGQFCSYDHREILTTMPDGFFLNDTEQKTIDKCYPSSKKCRNYGNDNNHNCTECISGFVLLDEPGFESNCYNYCLIYNSDENTLDYECISGEFTLINETWNAAQNEIIDSFDEIIQNKKPNLSYIINGKDYTVFINPIERYLNDSNVNIDFLECHKKLIEKYPTFTFRIEQINIKNSNPNVLNEDVEYKIYNQFGEVVDLSCCEDVKITIQNKINKEIFDLEKIQNFRNKGIDILNLEDDFYNNICYSYSDENSGSDMILKDRASDIYQNYSFCGKECENFLINNDLTYVNCSCDVKQEISKENKEGNFKVFLKPFLYSNFGVIKCYKLVFSISGK